MAARNLKSGIMRYKQLSDKLSDVCPKDHLFDCLVAIFIEDNNIKTKNTMILNCIKKAKKRYVASIRMELGKKCELDVIQKVADRLVDYTDRKKFGVVYTPDIVVNYIVNEVIHKTTKTICDPACGNGVFLLSVLKKMCDVTGRSASDIIEHSIYGMDILPNHIRHSKILLILYMLTTGEDKISLKFNLITCNSLTFKWRNKFSKILDGFDVVLGNPPYVRIQDISESEKCELAKRWDTCIGSYNLYFTFFETGMDMLNTHGVLGYICANSFFTSFAGKNLRKWLQENKYVKKILDFTHLVLFDATSYTCIIFLDKKNKFSIQYGYLTKYAELNKLSKTDFSANPYDVLDHNKWRLLKKHERKIINKIESTGKPLGEITEIRSGIATLKDKIYFAPYSKGKYLKKMHNGVEYLIEKSITKDIIKIPDVDRLNMVPTHKIIFPYVKIDGRFILITERVLEKKYPKCYQYLCAMKDILSQRDNGKKTYEAWYSYGRRQGFDVNDQKLLTPTFSHEPRFLFDERGNSFFCNGYAIHKSKISLEIIQKILNSSIMKYYIARTSVFVEGNYSCFQKNFIERFGIPNMSKADITCLQKINDPAQIDVFLSKKYEVNLLTH